MEIDEKRAGPVPVLVVFAPTASGKTTLALDLFAEDSRSPLAGRAELVSADSMQVYRGMDIGTAKATAEERSRLPHHLVDVQTPDIPFSAGKFVRLADQLCREIYGRGRLPVVLGGTGFYIRNFLCGLPTTPRSDPDLRLALQSRLKEDGAAVLYGELRRIDPAAALRIHPNDHYRILRALEISQSSGRPQSSFSPAGRLRSQFRFCVVVLWRERQELYGRIERRVAQMMEEGLPQEVNRLLAAGYGAGDPGMQAIGYREFLLPEVRNLGEPERGMRIQDLICRNSRRYAKRQYTYFRGIPEAHYFHAEDYPSIRVHIGDFMRSVGLCR